ncbi:nuclear pore complex protein Nup153-like [Xenopus laevis]|uniref:Nuclear pore complex protein Nup153-like n=1 Tax=Xenopus laevis TaxID=8355 RepID=A0A8J1L4F7_XENLA|nr:nuclear pore complex protein Nup153-like [Xenopus laevis]
MAAAGGGGGLAGPGARRSRRDHLSSGRAPYSKSRQQQQVSNNRTIPDIMKEVNILLCTFWTKRNLLRAITVLEQ